MTTNKTVSPAVGTRLLFENERVRVWDLCLEPGESTGLHRHECDYLYVVIGDGRLQAADGEGKRWEARDMKDGEVRFNQVSDEAVHEAFNVGPGPWRNIVVELKD
jgi:hypothetical protein